jgi:hypothetical protein
LFPLGGTTMAETRNDEAARCNQFPSMTDWTRPEAKFLSFSLVAPAVAVGNFPHDEWMVIGEMPVTLKLTRVWVCILLVTDLDRACLGMEMSDAIVDDLIDHASRPYTSGSFFSSWFRFFTS